MVTKTGHICEFSLLELYDRYKEAIDNVQNRDEAIGLGLEIMKDFDQIRWSRGDSGLLATLVGMALPGGQLHYMDFYCLDLEDLESPADSTS